MSKISQETLSKEGKAEWGCFLFVCFKTVSCFLLQTHNVFCFNRIACGGGKGGGFLLEESNVLLENSDKI